jgi:putative hydrolase of the HAD superfamily
VTIELVGFDADDTLWHNEDAFREVEHRFVELITPHALPGVDVADGLSATERANLSVYGYGVKAFGLSMIEAALTLTEGTVPGVVLDELLHLTRDLLEAPVRLLPNVADVLQQVAEQHRLVLITKGDLIHQTRKVTTSGLAHHFELVEVVNEKDPETYEAIIQRLQVKPEQFCMVGNSVKSDVLPVLAIGGNAVHVPYPMTWALEHAEPGHFTFAELESITELPAWLASQ